MIKQVVSLGPLAAANAALYAASQTPVSGTPLTLTGTAADVARRVLLTYGDESAARALALTGTNYNGQTIQETLVVPSGGSGTVSTAQDFLTVTRAVPSGGGWTAAMTLGTDTTASSPWDRVTEHVTPINIGVNCVVNGTVTYTVETTNDSLEAALPATTAGAPYGPLGPIPPIPTPFPLQTLQGQSANATGLIAQPINAWRVTITAGTGSVTATAIQGGIVQGH